ncbi:MAG: rod shape-determining protein MreC [Chromatiales bacterium]
MKLFVSQGPSSNTRLIVAMLIAVVLMVMDHKYQRLEVLRNSVAVASEPLFMIAGVPANVFGWLNEQITSHQTLISTNRRLTAENSELQGRMLRFQALEEENSRLRTQLSASLSVGDRVTLAELVGVNLSPYKQEVIIGRGSTAGVYSGQAVINDKGVMGQVTRVTPFRSTVLLITDTLHSIPVRVLRTGLRTIALGTGRIDRLELPYLPDSANIRVGDMLVTSGLGGRFPPDYPVARITSIEKGKDMRASIVVATPLANLAQDHDVMLVWSIDGSLDLPAEETASDETMPGENNSASQAESPGNG